MNANLPANEVLEKNLTVIGVSNAYGYTDAVINMLVQGAVNIDLFEKKILTEYDAAALLEERVQNPSYPKNTMTILKMVI